MINKTPFCQSGFPWRLLLKMLIDAAYTKTHKVLQLNCIQTLRVMSDVEFVKDEMRKLYRVKLKAIQCLTSEIAEMKDDLIQWLEYKNYKRNYGNKYSKLFI